MHVHAFHSAICSSVHASPYSLIHASLVILKCICDVLQTDWPATFWGVFAGIFRVLVGAAYTLFLLLLVFGRVSLSLVVRIVLLRLVYCATSRALCVACPTLKRIRAYDANCCIGSLSRALRVLFLSQTLSRSCLPFCRSLFPSPPLMFTASLCFHLQVSIPQATRNDSRTRWLLEQWKCCWCFVCLLTNQPTTECSISRARVTRLLGSVWYGAGMVFKYSWCCPCMCVGVWMWVWVLGCGSCCVLS